MAKASGRTRNEGFSPSAHPEARVASAHPAESEGRRGLTKLKIPN